MCHVAALPQDINPNLKGRWLRCRRQCQIPAALRSRPDRRSAWTRCGRRKSRRPVRRRLEPLLHGLGFGLAGIQERIGPSESEVSREWLDPLKPVEAEEADIVAETAPGEGIPHGHVVVEVLRFDLAIGDRSRLVLVSDRRDVLVEEGLHQALRDTRLWWTVARENAV